MTVLRVLCVYCGSSTGFEAGHVEVAAELGRALAERRIRLVYGGGRVGLMGAVAEAALAAGGEVYGVIPRHLQDAEAGHHGLTRLEVVETMHERKMRMFELSDAFCALPGGLGTLDETFEMVTWRQLGLHEKPVILLNTAGYWTPLLAMLRHQVEAGFLREPHLNYLRVASEVEEIFTAVAEHPEPTHPVYTKLA
jgi:uncharacterized protein (TIGR00730 family)